MVIILDVQFLENFYMVLKGGAQLFKALLAYHAC